MTSGHLVQECGEAISAALDKAEAVELLYLSPSEKADALKTLARLAVPEGGRRDSGCWRSPTRWPSRPVIGTWRPGAGVRPASTGVWHGATSRWRGRWIAGGPSWRLPTRAGTCRPRRPM